MEIETPEGKLRISDDELKLTRTDNGPDLIVSLSPVPEYKYERSIYGEGSLVIGGHVISLRNEQAATVIEELRRPRAKAAPRKATAPDARKSDGDTASAK